MKLRITIEREDDKPDRYGWKEEYQQIIDEDNCDVSELVTIINRPGVKKHDNLET